MASYNRSLSIDAEPWELAPRDTKTMNLEWHLSEADYNDSLEEFKLFYMGKEI